MRAASVGNTSVPEGEKVFGSSDAAGEVGGTDADALGISDSEWIDNNNREAALIQCLDS
jgi:hypothetical protein